MSFLKKLGQVVLKVVGLWTGLSPLLGNLYTTGGTADKVVDKLGSVFGVIGTVEQVFTAAFTATHTLPSEKLAAATPFVAQLVQSTDLLAGKKPKDEALFIEGVKDLVNAVVKILNSYGE